MRDRVIPLEGARNFRDMGGYVGAQGRRVRWGMLYRSDHLASLTSGDIRTLRELGVRTVFDFRSPFEIGGAPDVYKPERVFVVNPDNYTAEMAAQAGLGGSLEEENRRLVSGAAALTPEDLRENHPVLAMYRDLVELPEGQEAYRRLLRLLAEDETPASVQHCRGGKDRTGYGAALVLLLLGVSMEDIVADYLLTGELRRERNAFKMDQYRALTDDSVVLDYLYSLIDTRPEFIQEAFAHMERLCGSVDEYLRRCLGVTEELKERLRALYLEETP